MLSFCKDLCRSKKDKDRGKKDKKDKHGGSKEDGGKAKHKMKNVHSWQIIGQGKKNIDQDSFCSFEMVEENVPCRFFGVFDGHGDFGKEVRDLGVRL